MDNSMLYQFLFLLALSGFAVVMLVLPKLKPSSKKEEKKRVLEYFPIDSDINRMPLENDICKTYGNSLIIRGLRLNVAGDDVSDKDFRSLYIDIKIDPEHVLICAFISRVAGGRSELKIRKEASKIRFEPSERSISGSFNLYMFFCGKSGKLEPRIEGSYEDKSFSIEKRGVGKLP